MIHVCFSLYDKNGRYSKFTGTTILSLFENTTLPITVHILHDNTLTQDNRDKFIYLAVRYGQAVKFYNVEELCADKLKKMIELIPDAVNSRVSVAALYRLLIPQVVPAEIEKCIYLDSDIIVNLDVSELWKMELADKVLGVITEMENYFDSNKIFSLCREGLVKGEDYFNSGVLLVNLKLLRNEESTIIDALRFRSQNPMYQDYFDQNILNYCFSTKTVKLPEKFNSCVYIARGWHKANLGKKIYHFAGSAFGFDMSDEFNRLWMNYFIKTPWFNVEAIGRLYKNFQEIYRQLHSDDNKSTIKLSAAMSGKTRVFITVESELRKLVETFSVRNSEEIIIIADSIHVNKIIEKIYSSRDEKIFFILLPNFPFMVLTEAGLVQGRDFIDASEFLSEINFNSKLLLQSM